VMIKTGVYGLMRYFLWLVPAGSRGEYPLGGWGLVIASLGVVTLFTGTVQALHQGQTKRLLAYSSIGQVGYILMGLGACLALLDSSQLPLAVLALGGALLHTLNHGIFKGLLFLNAGSLLHATGTQELDRLGGLSKHMPATALATLVGVAAIVGAPLTSGFASKWHLYGATIGGAPGARFLPIYAVVAILTSGLTLAVFLRFFGAAFLSRTSALVGERAQMRGTLEVRWMMLAPKLGLAAICVAAGLAPALLTRFVQHALDQSRQGLGVLLADSALALGGGWEGPSPLAVGAVLALMLGLAWGLARAGGAPRRAVPPWLCGYAPETELNRYQARHFYAQLGRFLPALDKEKKRAPAPPRRHVEPNYFHDRQRYIETAEG